MPSETFSGYSDETLSQLANKYGPSPELRVIRALAGELLLARREGGAQEGLITRSAEDLEIMEDYCEERSGEAWSEAQAAKDRSGDHISLLVRSAFLSGVELALRWVKGDDCLNDTWAEAMESGATPDLKEGETQ